MKSKNIQRLAVYLVVLAALFAAFAALNPGLFRHEMNRGVKSCQENLTKIDGAKEQFALEANRWPGFPAIVWSDIVASPDGTGFLKNVLKCPSGGEYVIGDIGVNPICTSGLPGHSLTEIGLAITTTQ